MKREFMVEEKPLQTPAGKKQTQNLKTYAVIAVFAAAASWVFATIIMAALSIVMIVIGLVEYKKNGGPKMHYYALYVAIAILIIEAITILILGPKMF